MSTVKFDALRALSKFDYSMTIERGMQVIDALAPFFAPDPNAPAPGTVVSGNAEVMDALRMGKKITAIKAARAALLAAGLSATLKDAKDAVDAICADRYPSLVSPTF